MKFNSIFEKYLFYNLPVFLFSLLPFFLVTGPFLSDLSVSLISLLFLIYCLKSKNFSFFKNIYFYLFLIFWSYLVINSLINNYNTDSFKISFFYVRFGIFVVAIIALLQFDAKFVKYLFYCLFFCFTVLTVDGFYQYFTGENIVGYKSISRHRVSSFFFDELILGSYLSRLWPIFFALSTLFFKIKKIYYPIVFLFICSEVLIFLSGDRSAFFNINLSAIFIILFSQNLFKLRLVTMLSSILLIVMVKFINPSSFDRVVNKTIRDMNLNNKNQTTFIFSKQHTHHYITAYKMFR